MPTNVWIEEWDVNSQLRALTLSREGLIRVVGACVQGYDDCTDNDPPASKGWEPWRLGTREFRDLLVPGGGGWMKDDSGIPSVRHDGMNVRIIVLNTDDATGIPERERGPRNRIKKGICHERALADPQPWLDLPNPFAQAKFDVWYLCIYVNGDDVRAEMSRPERISGGFIADWKDRIIIVGKGDWDNARLRSPDEDVGPDIEVKVSRKK